MYIFIFFIDIPKKINKIKITINKLLMYDHYYYFYYFFFIFLRGGGGWGQGREGKGGVIRNIHCIIDSNHY